MATIDLGQHPVLLVIDMQHDFIDSDAPFPCVGVERIIPKIKRVLGECRRIGIPVIFAQEAHRSDLSDLGRERDPWHPPHCLEGTRGVQIIDDLKPEAGDYVVTKRRWSAFFGTDLDLLLKGLGADTIVLAGVATNACVMYTAYDGWERDYRIRILADCTAAGSEKQYLDGLEAIKYFQADASISADQFMEEARKIR